MNDAMPLFGTARLDVRRLGDADLEAMLTVYGDAEAMRHVGDGQPLDHAGCRRWIAITRDNYARRGYGMFALIDRVRRETIGFCGLVHPGGQPEVELKYAIRRADWGRGYASEVVPALLAWGRDVLKLNRVIATVDDDHAASQAVLLKCGLHHVETREVDDGGPPVRVYAWEPT